jgi:hypothetical protein
LHPLVGTQVMALQVPGTEFGAPAAANTRCLRPS